MKCVPFLRWYLFVALAISSGSHLWAVITTCASISELPRVIAGVTKTVKDPKKVLLVTDIDRVVVRPDFSPLCDPEEMQPLCAAVAKKYQELYGLDLSPDRIHRLIAYKVHQCPVESERTVRAFKRLRERRVPVMGLTASRWEGTSLCPNPLAWRHSHLHDAGIDFGLPSDWGKTGPLSGDVVRYFDGKRCIDTVDQTFFDKTHNILFTRSGISKTKGDGDSKGAALILFLSSLFGKNEFTKAFKHIFFIDDQADKVHDVATILDDYGIPNTALHYTRRPVFLNPQYDDAQFAQVCTLINGGTWVSYQEMTKEVKSPTGDGMVPSFKTMPPWVSDGPEKDFGDGNLLEHVLRGGNFSPKV